MRSLVRFAFFVTCLAVACEARTIGLGIFSFDVLIPPDAESPGLNTFTITNLTGDPAAGGAALPPEFPIFSPVTLQNPRLTFNGQTVAFDAIAPGSVSPHWAPDTVLFSSASLSVSLGELSWVLDDGTLFTPVSRTLTVTLWPSSGTHLQAGVDLVLITASNVPEPGTFMLVFWAMCVVYSARRARRRGTPA